MNLNRGIQWPVAIAIAILGVFSLGIWTVMFALKSPVQESKIYMETYQSVNKNVNDIIKANIKFDKKYTVEYTSKGLDQNAAVVQYKLTDKKSNPINSAKISIVLTRPNIHTYDVKLENPTVSDGVYTFQKVKLPKAGRWDIMAKVVVGDDYKFYNLKADTRIKEVHEY